MVAVILGVQVGWHFLQVPAQVSTFPECGRLAVLESPHADRPQGGDALPMGFDDQHIGATIAVHIRGAQGDFSREVAFDPAVKSIPDHHVPAPVTGLVEEVENDLLVAVAVDVGGRFRKDPQDLLGIGDIQFDRLLPQERQLSSFVAEHIDMLGKIGQNQELLFPIAGEIINAEETVASSFGEGAPILQGAGAGIEDLQFARATRPVPGGHRRRNRRPEDRERSNGRSDLSAKQVPIDQLSRPGSERVRPPIGRSAWAG